MAENKRFYWLKLQEDFFSSKRIKKLRKLAGGDTYTIIYLKIQLLSINTGGILKYTGLENSFAEELALDIDEDAENVKVTVSYLQSCGLLEVKEDDQYFLPYAVECTGSETASTIRSRKSRDLGILEEKALQCNTNATQMQHQCNNLQRLCNGEKEKEKEKDIEKEIEKDKEVAPTPKLNVEKAWDDTFGIYPKKSQPMVAKQMWMDMLISAVDKKAVAELIYKATMYYLSDYKKNNPEDEKYRYLPKYGDWLQNDSLYWIKIVEQKEREDKQ